MTEITPTGEEPRLTPFAVAFGVALILGLLLVLAAWWISTGRAVDVY